MAKRKDERTTGRSEKKKKVDPIGKLKERYAQLHPLIFQRSLERSQTLGELFDVLDEFPQEFPIVWNHTKRRWETTKDIFQVEAWKNQTLG